MALELIFFFSPSRYLNGLERMQIPKPLKEEFGGGVKEFSINEVSESNTNKSILFYFLNLTNCVGELETMKKNRIQICIIQKPLLFSREGGLNSEKAA